jgi:hypothetical protein
MIYFAKFEVHEEDPSPLDIVRNWTLLAAMRSGVCPVVDFNQAVLMDFNLVNHLFV